MAKIKLNRPAGSIAGANDGNTPAILSLVFAILGWLVLPFIGALVAVITGHIGRKRAKAGAPRGGMALAGLILGYLWWALLIPMMGIIAALALPAYQDYVQRAKAHQAKMAQDSGDALNSELDEVAANNPADALGMAKLWVAARVSKGTPLNEISEELKLSPAQQQYWRSIRIQQGTINAIPAKGDGKQALVLLSMQNGNKLVWVCGGQIPDMAQAECSQ
ncbi:DUF4190 domain-containing protein [Paralysiella testudinis]|uniref:DUF4190 domain-containing protein n=1 Tax=Paralysiella testudinis TaxID=2809020 RepID=A0A892ZGH6_9NEIS|nr:DUF4190 domain-containing protein [Paralysiella testudinis]QRQ81650.1 DUF4190 domain-containing protein [Paralysiella testudinis]